MPQGLCLVLTQINEAADHATGVVFGSDTD